MYNLENVTICILGYELRRFRHATIKGSGKFEIAKMLAKCNHKIIAVATFNKRHGIEYALNKLQKEYLKYFIFDKLRKQRINNRKQSVLKPI